MASQCRRDTSEESEGGEASGSSPTAGQRAGRPKTLRKTPSSRSRHKRPPVRLAAFEVPHHSPPSAPPERLAPSHCSIQTLLQTTDDRRQAHTLPAGHQADESPPTSLLRELRPGLFNDMHPSSLPASCPSFPYQVA